MTKHHRRLPASFAVVLTPLFVSILMSCIISGVATASSLGLSSNFVPVWSKAWATSWLIAFPSLFFLLPIVRRVVGKLVRSP